MPGGNNKESYISCWGSSIHTTSIAIAQTQCAHPTSSSRASALLRFACVMQTEQGAHPAQARAGAHVQAHPDAEESDVSEPHQFYSSCTGTACDAALKDIADLLTVSCRLNRARGSPFCPCPSWSACISTSWRRSWLSASRRRRPRPQWVLGHA